MNKSNDMELPNKYNTWMEFEKDINGKYHGAKSIKLINEGEHARDVPEYNINAIKAKAFDEIISKIDFTKSEVYALQSQGIENVNPGMFDFLMNLAH